MTGRGATAFASLPAVNARETTGIRILALGADAAAERGIDLPNPLGANVFLIYMRRDIEVYDVRIALPGEEPVSISDLSSFTVDTGTALATLNREVRDLGTGVVEVDQRPFDPVTCPAGGSAAFGKRWEVPLEAGSNLNVASVGVCAVAFRF